LNEVYVFLPLSIPRIAEESVPIKKKKKVPATMWLRGAKGAFYENDG
jgi:hypothetical protein